jgi:hypothetical protein
MRRWLMTAGMLGLCVCSAHGSGPKGEIASDRRSVAAEKREMKGDARESRAEEAALRRDIYEAVCAGDMATANRLKVELRDLHRGNMQEKRGDTADLRAARGELKSDITGARAAGLRPHGRGPRLR